MAQLVPPARHLQAEDLAMPGGECRYALPVPHYLEVGEQPVIALEAWK